MPKILVGCLVVLLVVVVGGGTAGYFLVVKPAYQFATDVGGFASEFQELNQSVERGGAYAPPADGQLTPEQFQRFLVAQRDMREGMQQRLGELDEKWQEMRADLERRDREPNIVEMVTAYRDLGDLLLEAKRNQVAALNRYQFSLQEYAWVRNQVYMAMGEEVAVAAFGEQGHPQRQRQVSDEVLELVSGHREELMEGYALAWFGL
jgi:negative regulator of genetic competence, sporulation and motility